MVDSSLSRGVKLYSSCSALTNADRREYEEIFECHVGVHDRCWHDILGVQMKSTTPIDDRHVTADIFSIRYRTLHKYSPS